MGRGGEKTKPNKANMSAFGRKSEARIPKSENPGAFTGCLLPVSVGERVEWMLFEKTKPICRPLVGNPKFEFRNPKQFEKTNPIFQRPK